MVIIRRLVCERCLKTHVFKKKKNHFSREKNKFSCRHEKTSILETFYDPLFKESLLVASSVKMIANDANFDSPRRDAAIDAWIIAEKPK